MNKHTEGPWEVLNNYVKRVGGGVVATTARNNAACRFEVDVASFEDAANAALIAAAPDLLGALKVAVEVMKDHNIDEAMAGEFEVFTDAIAKAEGRA